jgi:type I restriction enzyme R subunit
LNHAILLDDSATELDPQNPNPRSVHGGESEKDPLDEIIKSFNDRWFHGWDATPEDQRVKFVAIGRHIQAHPDYQTKIADNHDLQNRDLAFKKILDDVMSQQRKKELELYKLYAKDESFYQALFDTLKIMTSTPGIRL